MSKKFSTIMILSAFAAMAATAPAETTATKDFCVINMTPQNELPSEVKYPAIQVQFSEPVVALKELGTPSNSSDVLSITPPLKGVYRWYGTSILSFESSDEAIPQKEYTVTVNKDLRSIKGTKITGELSYRFHTEELKLTRIQPGYGEVKENHSVNTESVPPSVAKDIAVYFNAPVNAAVVKDSIRVLAGKESVSIPFKAAQEEKNMVRLSLQELPPEDTDIRVVLAKGAMADRDCYPTSADREKRFHTLVTFAIKNVNENPSWYANEYSNPVTLYFTSPLKQDSEAELAKHIKSDVGAITAENLMLNEQLLIVYGLPVTYNSKYTLSVDSEVTDVYGRKLDKDYLFTITVPAARSYARFANSGFVELESQFPPAISFEHQNIKSGSRYSIEPLTLADGSPSILKGASFALDPATFEQDKKINQRVDLAPYLQSVNGESRGAVRFTADIVYEYSWTDWRTKEKQTQQHTLSNEQVIQVTNLGITTRYAYNRAVVLVTDIKTGKAVPGATVTAFTVPVDTSFADRLTGALADKKSAKGFPVCSSAVTDKDGIAELSFEPRQLKSIDNNQQFFFEAKTADDRVRFAPNGNFVRVVRGYSSGSSFSTAEDPQMVALVFSDRGLYKPGETVTYRVIDRNLVNGEYKAVTGNEANYTVEFKENSWRSSKTYYSSKGKLSANGGASGSFTVPADLKPGTYQLCYSRTCNGTTATQGCDIQVQFFEKLRFEAHASIPDGTYYRGDGITAEISANYLGGGSMSDSTFTARWTSENASYRPAGKAYKDYRFGPVSTAYYGTKSLGTEKGALDADGKARTSQGTEEDFAGSPRSYRMEAQVVDSGNQAVSTSASVLVHPARFYLGISGTKNKGGFPKKGETLSFDYITLTPNEKAPASTDLPKGKEARLTLQRENWKRVQHISENGYVYTDYEKEMITEEERSVPLPSDGKVLTLSVTPPEGGAYMLRLETKDANGNPVITETTFYVTSSDWYWRTNDGQEIKLTPDKERYEVGDTAQIMFQSELPKGKYLLTIEREGIVSEKVLDVDSPTSVVDVKIEKDFVPVIYVALSSFSVRGEADPRKRSTVADADKPKSYFGVTALSVSTKTKRFDISIKMDKPSYEPGEKAKITLQATRDGKAVPNAEITFMAVDRGVVDLINYHVDDPVDYFYAQYRFPNYANGGDSRSLLISQAQEVAEAEEAVYTMNMAGSTRMFKSAAMMDDAMPAPEAMALGADTGSEDGDMKVRKNFASTAAFAPALVTDKKGKATYTFTVPDSLTAYRLTAVGVQGDTFALSEDEMQVAEPISVRPVLPRELRLDDKGELGVTISNIGKKSQKVTIDLALYEGIEKTGEVQDKNAVQKLPGKARVLGKASKKVSVGGQKTTALMFDVEALSPGWITVEFTVRSKEVNEKILLPLQIERPYIFETVTTTGAVREAGDGQEKIVLPGGAEDGRGSLYVQLDPTRLGVLREAVSYVFHYPYGCMEQRSAAVLPLVAFGDYIKVFGLNSEVKYPKGVAEQEIHSWAPVQRGDGGFPYWPDGSESSPYVSMRIAEILALAEQNDIPVGKINKAKLASYLIKEADKMRSGTSGSSSWGLYYAAYAYYAAQRIGGTVGETALSGIVSAENADVEALALCGLCYLNMGKAEQARAVAGKLRNFTRLTTRGIDITPKFGRHYWCFFNGDAESYALFLQLFTRLHTEDDINQHLVWELLKLQKARKGYWQSTAVTSRVLIALNDYIKSNMLENLNFTAEVLLNGRKLLGGSFNGVAAEAVETKLDFGDKALADMPKDRELDLSFAKQGTGTLYYTASMRYAIPAAKQEARDEGICVYTEIFDVETGKAVTGSKLEAGRTYREKVHISSVIDNEYVALRAPVPAGCEILNAAFVTTGTLQPDAAEEAQKKANTWYWNRNAGLSYKGIYDAEVQYFWNYFPRGSQTVEFQFRATRKGEYGTPCTTAECMYEEEIFGRSDGKVWSIE